jgi:hypothetical protein
MMVYLFLTSLLYFPPYLFRCAASSVISGIQLANTAYIYIHNLFKLYEVWFSIQFRSLCNYLFWKYISVKLWISVTKGDNYYHRFFYCERSFPNSTQFIKNQRLFKKHFYSKAVCFNHTLKITNSKSLESSHLRIKFQTPISLLIYKLNQFNFSKSPDCTDKFKKPTDYFIIYHQQYYVRQRHPNLLKIPKKKFNKR